MNKKPIIFICLFLASLTLYLLTLSPDWGAINIFNTWDGLEYVLCSTLFGIDHPPGHPFYLLAAKVFSSIFIFGSIAYRMNLFSAVFGAMTVAMIYLVVELALRIARKPERAELRHGVAILSGTIFAVSKVFWTHSVITEVHTFYLFLMLVLFYFSLRFLEEGGRKWIYGSALVSGLLISTNILNALTVVFPVVVFFTILNSVSRQHRLSAIDWARCFILFAIGVSFYLYYFAVSRFTPGFVQPMNIMPDKLLGSLPWYIWYLSGKAWIDTGMFSLGVLFRNIPGYLWHLLDGYSILLLAGFLFALAWTGRDILLRRIGIEVRALSFLLFCYVIVLIPQLSVTEAGSPGPSMFTYTANIYLPSFLLYVLIAGIGLGMAIDLIYEKALLFAGSDIIRRKCAVLLLVSSFVFPAYLLARNYPSCDLRSEGVGYRFAKGMLEGLPDRSVIYSKLVYELVGTYFTRVENIVGNKSLTIENPDLFRGAALQAGSTIIDIEAVIKRSMFEHMKQGDGVYLAGDCVDLDKAPEVLLMSNILLTPWMAGDLSPLAEKPYPTELLLYRVRGERRGEVVWGMPRIDNRGMSNDGRFDLLELLGYSLPNEEGPRIGRSRMDIDLYWKPLQKIQQDLLGVFLVYTESLQKVDPGAAAAFFTIGGSYPTSKWRPGDTIRDRCFYYLPHLPPGRYYLALGVLTSADRAMPYYPAAYKENGQSYDFVMLMPFTIGW